MLGDRLNTGHGCFLFSAISQHTSTSAIAKMSLKRSLTQTQPLSQPDIVSPSGVRGLSYSKVKFGLDFISTMKKYQKGSSRTLLD